MPKAKTIKVVEVEPINESVNEVIAEPIAEPIVESIVEQQEVKPKAKRQPNAKKAEPIIEPEVTVESTLNESVVELKIPAAPTLARMQPDELIKQLKVQADKVKCPDCEKMVASKSLKYSHKYTCLSKQAKEHNDNTATNK